MTDKNDLPEATLTPAQEQRLEALRGAHGDVRCYDLGGRRFVLRKPKRAEYLKHKTDSKHPDLSVQARAGEILARMCLVPFDPSGKVEDERKAFDELGEEFPALPDILGVAAVDMAYGPFEVRELKASPSPASDSKAT